MVFVFFFVCFKQNNIQKWFWENNKAAISIKNAGPTGYNYIFKLRRRTEYTEE